MLHQLSVIQRQIQTERVQLAELDRALASSQAAQQQRDRLERLGLHRRSERQLEQQLAARKTELQAVHETKRQAQERAAELHKVVRASHIQRKSCGNFIQFEFLLTYHQARVQLEEEHARLQCSIATQQLELEHSIDTLNALDEARLYLQAQVDAARTRSSTSSTFSRTHSAAAVSAALGSSSSTPHLPRTQSATSIASSSTRPSSAVSKSIQSSTSSTPALPSRPASALPLLGRSASSHTMRSSSSSSSFSSAPSGSRVPVPANQEVLPLSRDAIIHELLRRTRTSSIAELLMPCLPLYLGTMSEEESIFPRSTTKSFDRHRRDHQRDDPDGFDSNDDHDVDVDGDIDGDEDDDEVDMDSHDAALRAAGEAARRHSEADAALVAHLDDMELKLDVLERHVRQGGQLDERLIPDLADLHLRAVGLRTETGTVDEPQNGRHSQPQRASSSQQPQPAASESLAKASSSRPQSASGIAARAVVSGLLKKNSSNTRLNPSNSSLHSPSRPNDQMDKRSQK